MDTKQSFLHVSINFPPLQLQSLSFSRITIFLDVILPLIIIHDTFFAIFLPCSYTPLNYHSEQFPLLLHTLSLFVHDTILPHILPFYINCFLPLFSLAVTLPCSYTPLQLYIIYLIYTILYFTIYYSITITQYFLLVYIHNPIILYPILYIFLSLL